MSADRDRKLSTDFYALNALVASLTFLLELLLLLEQFLHDLDLLLLLLLDGESETAVTEAAEGEDVRDVEQEIRVVDQQGWDRRRGVAEGARIRLGSWNSKRLRSIVTFSNKTSCDLICSDRLILSHQSLIFRIFFYPIP